MNNISADLLFLWKNLVHKDAKSFKAFVFDEITMQYNEIFLCRKDRQQSSLFVSSVTKVLW